MVLEDVGGGTLSRVEQFGGRRAHRGHRHTGPRAATWGQIAIWFAERAPRRPTELRCALYGLHAERIETAVVVRGIMAEEEQSLRLMSVGEGQRVGMLKPHGSRSKCRSSRRCAERRVLRTPADACSRRIAYATFSSGRAPDSALSVVSAVSGLDDQERRWTNLTAALRGDR